MGVFKLKNGATIDLNFQTPSIFGNGAPTLSFDRNDVTNSFLNTFAFPRDPSGRPLPINAISMHARGKVEGLAQPQLDKCALKFVQLMRLSTVSAVYAGKKQEEGTVTWRFSGALLGRTTDCFVAKDNDQDTSFPFQLRDAEYGREKPNVLIANHHDTPGAEFFLALRNKESKSLNFLSTFFDRRDFEVIAVFVHEDQTFEVLESIKWRMTTAVKLNWIKLEPKFAGVPTVSYTSDPQSTPVFGRTDEFMTTINQRIIANILTRRAIRTLATGAVDANMDRVDNDDPHILPGEDFWQP